MRRTFNQLQEKTIREQKKLIGSETKITEEQLKYLPEVVSKHLTVSGFIGKPMAWNADVHWKETSLTLKVGQKPRPMTTRHFISSKPIARLMHMKIHRMPFVGLDVYANDKGWLKGKILGLFPIINVRGLEVTISELITVFCEFPLLNSFFLLESVRYETINKTTVKATLTDKLHSVSGILHFDEEGLLSHFTTDERYRLDENNQPVKTPFITHIRSYKKQEDLLIPEKISVCWLLDGKEFEYFAGTIDRIDINVQ